MDFTNKSQAELDEFIRKGTNSQKREALREINIRACEQAITQLPYEEYLANIVIASPDNFLVDVTETPLQIGDCFLTRGWNGKEDTGTVTLTLRINDPTIFANQVWVLAAAGFTYSYVEDDNPGPGQHLGVKVQFTLATSGLQTGSPYAVSLRRYAVVPDTIFYNAWQELG